MSHASVSEGVPSALSESDIAPDGRPTLVLAGSPTRLLWCNEAALRTLGASDREALASRLATGAEPGAKRLRQLLSILGPSAAARLEPLRFLDGGVRIWRVRRSSSTPDALVVALEEQIQSGSTVATQTETAPSTPEPAAEGPDAMLEPILARWRRQFPGARILRFRWRASPDNKITHLETPLCEVVGCATEELIGQDVETYARARGADPEGRLEGALATRETWAKLRLLWPIAGAEAAVPVTLGATPLFGGDRRFEGWAGFGVVELEGLQRLSPQASPAAVMTDKAEEPSAEAAAPGVAGDSANVIALHSRQAQRPSEGEGIAAQAGEGERPQPPQQPPTEAPSGLTISEQLAFQEIAVALGSNGALTDWTPAEEPPAGETAPSEQDFGGSDAETPLATALRRTLDNAPVGLLVSRSSTIVWANARALELFGCANLTELRLSREAARAIEEMSATASPAPFAPLSAKPTGAGPAGLEHASHETDWFGEPALISLVRAAEPDSSRVRSLEAELRRRDSEARELHAILDTATDGVAVLDGEGRLISLNRAGEALFGSDQNEVAGEPFTALLASESHAPALDYFKLVASNGVASLLNDGRELVGRARRGGAFPIFLTLGRVTTGGATKFCAVMRDMTAWKKVEHELNEARREAERASALKSDFLAKVSHEIRTPLNAILGFAEVIMDERFGPVGNERYREYLKDIHASGTHVMSLVNDLLDLSKIEAGKMELTFENVDANKIVAECVSIMQPQANSERVIVRLSTAPRLPQVMADERSLRQIVLNILSNAVKFNEPGGQVIVSTALTDAGHAVIRIRDTGIGMSDSELITALEPFRQVQTSRQTSGTGLGLPLTKALVEANRASFTVKSKKTEGTLVEVTFPPARVLAA